MILNLRLLPIWCLAFTLIFISTSNIKVLSFDPEKICIDISTNGIYIEEEKRGENKKIDEKKVKEEMIMCILWESIDGDDIDWYNETMIVTKEGGCQR